MTLLDRLSSIVGDSHVLTGADVSIRSTDWGDNLPCQARAIVRPGSTVEVSSILSLCYESEQSIVPAGGRTGLVGGTDAATDDIVLSLERMTTIESVNSVNRTIAVEA